MRFAVRSLGSLRMLLIVMIAAPVVPTIASSILVLARLAHGRNAAASIAEIALAGMGLRILGGGVALWAAGRLIRATRLLSRAAGALDAGASPSQTRSGIGEIDDVLEAIGAAAQSLRRRSEAYQSAEAARRDSEARLSDFAETGSDWYWQTDRQHRFTYLSDRIRAFGQDPTSRLGRARWELVAEAGSEPEKWRDHRAALERHEPFREFVYTRKVGNDPEQTVSVSGKPIFDAAGEFCGYRGTARDISAKVRAQRELRAATAEAEAASLAKSRFLANMSHELRTPLNAILGFSEMLERGTAGALQERQQEYVGYIRQSGSHLLDIINEILDLAKIDAGKLDLEEDAPIEVRALADACVALVAERAAAGVLKLTLQVENAMPRLVAELDQAQADPAEPARQRDQVHRSRRRRRPRHPPRRRWRRRIRGTRHRIGHDRGRDRDRARAVWPGRHRPRPQPRGHRPRAAARPAADRIARRRPRDRQR